MSEHTPGPWRVTDRPRLVCPGDVPLHTDSRVPRAQGAAVTRDLLDEIKTKWNIPVTLPMAVPWGKDDVVWLVQEVERLRAEAKRADEEATKLANSDLATTEQVIRALRAEVAALRAEVAALRAEGVPKAQTPAPVGSWGLWLAEDAARRRADAEGPIPEWTCACGAFHKTRLHYCNVCALPAPSRETP